MYLIEHIKLLNQPKHISERINNRVSVSVENEWIETICNATNVWWKRTEAATTDGLDGRQMENHDENHKLKYIK